MNKTRYGARYWSERTPASRRRAHPVLRGQHESDVVVIGGGLVGATAAYVLAHAGARVMLVEANRMAEGATAGGLGLITPEPDTWFRSAAAMRGRRVAKPAWQQAKHGAADLAVLLRRLKIKCDLGAVPLVINSRSTAEASQLRKEQTARKSGGIDAPWLAGAAAGPELGAGSEGALRLRDAWAFDPVRATLGLAAAAEKAGARLFEQSRATRTQFTRKDAQVSLDSGARIRTRFIVVATGEPGALFGQLRRHVKRLDGFAVVTDSLPAAMRRGMGPRTTMTIERGETSRRLRWLDHDRVLFAGAEQRPAPPRHRDAALVQRTGQLMYELSLRYPALSGIPSGWSWEVPVVSTLDGLPWIGPHRNYPFHFFALALGWHADTLAAFAARAALRQLQGKPGRGDDAFGFYRVLDNRSYPSTSRPATRRKCASN